MVALRHSCLYEGWVRHRRHLPILHRFRYRMFMAYLDLDELETLTRAQWPLSTDGGLIAVFRRRDHLGPESQSLREAVADRYSAMSFVAAKQNFDAELAAAGKSKHDDACERCHSEGGSNAEDEAGILTGQWLPYLQTAFDEYASGDREQLEKMKVAMDELSDADVQALLNYYASQQ